MSDRPMPQASALAILREQITKRHDAFAQLRLDLDLTRGKPSAQQLDLSNGLLQLPGAERYLAGNADCRNYGVLQGLPELRSLLAPLFGAAPGQLIIGGNSSLALMHDAIVFALLAGTCDSERPWARQERVAFLCPVPGYDRHFAICERFGIEMISVPLGDDGPDMDRVEELAASDPAIKGMWCVPKYSNPTGAVYSPEAVERLARLKTAAPDFRVFWDNAYAVHHLSTERIEIADFLEACRRHGHDNRAFIFGSTSKITFAGAGVALFAGSPANVSWYLKAMEKRTIGDDKLNQLRHVQLLRSPEGVLALMERHREILAPKFASVLEILERHLGEPGPLGKVASWTRPRGGYFITLTVPRGCAARAVALAGALGIKVTPAGSAHPYRKDPEDAVIRIAPSFPELPEVSRAAEGLALSVLRATVEQWSREQGLGARP
jgi:DNA-binding transcriptional MocR family regulator